MDFKTAAIAATAAGSILLTGVVFTGSVNLADIRSYGFGWADRVNTSVNETKEMLQKFNLFKGDVTAQLNEKVAKINELNAKIADLVSKVGAGQVNLEAANNEIARLNEELDKANQEVQALKDQYQIKDAEVEAAFAELATDEQMDTTMTIATQNPDTVIPADTTTEPTPEEPAPEEPVNDYATEEAAVTNKLKTSYPTLSGLTVTMSATNIIVTASNLTSIIGVNDSGPIADIESAAGVDITSQSKTGTNTYTYTY